MTRTALTHVAADTPVDDCVAILMRDGGLIVDSLFDDELIDALNSDLQPYLNAHEDGEPFFEGAHTRRASGLFARTSRMPEIAMNPLYYGISEKVLCAPVPTWLGDERLDLVVDMQISLTMAIRIGPGEKAQPLHRDDGAVLWRHPDYGREARVQIMVALSDFTEANGATRVIPGSNHWDDSRPPKVNETIPAEMTKGSALIWLGSTYHGGGANVTADGFRTGLTMAYDLGNVRSEENHLLTLPLETWRSLPKRLQVLLGWTRAYDYLGYVEIDGHMADPNELLTHPEYTAMGVGLPKKS
jgi:hypothetical protein